MDGNADTAQVLRYINEVADRAEGQPPTPDFDRLTDQPNGHQPAAAHHLGVAREHSHMGTRQPSTARLRRVKLLITSAMRPVTSYQTTYNSELAEAVSEIMLELEAGEERSAVQARRVGENERLAADLGDRLNGLSTRTDQLAEASAQLCAQQEEISTQLSNRVDEVSAGLDLGASTIEDQRSEMVHLRQHVASELQLLRGRQEIILREARAALRGDAGPEPLTALSRELSRTYDELYGALENTFRGSRTHVKDLATVYIDDVTELGGGPVLDVGCGRGEWLEVLGDQGIDAYGVDTNEDFVARNHELGLDARHGDALAHLRDLREGFLRAVTAFHVVEHLSLDTLVGFVDAALHALQPGGALIMETPNPTNLRVGAAAFYIDPTHLKPLHPQFLEFLVLQRGFVNVELRFQHETEGPRFHAEGGTDRSVVDDLNWAMYGPADYAVIAHKVETGDA